MAAVRADLYITRNIKVCLEIERPPKTQNKNQTKKKKNKKKQNKKNQKKNKTQPNW